MARFKPVVIEVFDENTGMAKARLMPKEDKLGQWVYVLGSVISLGLVVVAKWMGVFG